MRLCCEKLWLAWVLRRASGRCSRLRPVCEGFSQQIFSYAMRSLARAQKHAVLLGRRCAVEKLADFLVDWAAHSPESEVLTLEMPRRDIADYLGLTVETVSRAFAHLESKALIELPTARHIRFKNLEELRHLNS